MQTAIYTAWYGSRSSSSSSSSSRSRRRRDFFSGGITIPLLRRPLSGSDCTGVWERRKRSSVPNPGTVTTKRENFIGTVGYSLDNIFEVVETVGSIKKKHNQAQKSTPRSRQQAIVSLSRKTTLFRIPAA